MLVDHVRRSGAPRDRLAHDLGADAAGDHGAGACVRLPQGAAQAAGVGAAGQVKAVGRHAGGAHVLEQRALVVEAEQPHLGAARGQSRDQRGPVALGAAAVHVGCDEQEPHQARLWVASTSPARAAGR